MSSSVQQSFVKNCYYADPRRKCERKGKPIDICYKIFRLTLFILLQELFWASLCQLQWPCKNSDSQGVSKVLQRSHTHQESSGPLPAIQLRHEGMSSDDSIM